MALRDELAEPWGLLLGATAGGAAWALHLPETAIVAPLVGVAVWLTKAAVSALEHRHAAPAAPAVAGGRPLPVDARAAEGRWLARAKRAADSFGDLAGGMTAGPLAERVALMRPQVDDTMATLARLAGQATAAGRALERIDPQTLDAEERRLAAQRAAATGEIAAELDRSLASIEVQRQIHDRLQAARTGVLVRLESGTLGLESLVARVVELSAMATGGPTGETGAIEALTDELEGIRQGLAETEDVTRQALRAYQRSKEEP